MPAISTNFPDVLDARFARIFDEQWAQLPDRIPLIYGSPPFMGPQKQDLRFSDIGAFGDVPEFSGSIDYDDVYEGYDYTFTHKEYAKGFQVQRKLFDDAQYGIMDAKPQGMSTAYFRTRQRHAAQTFINSFSVDDTWQTGGDGVALCSNSHTTRASGVSTATGFDNLITASFSATALTAARIQFRGYRGDRAERISNVPDLVIHPPDLYAEVFETVQSAGKPGQATNDRNVHEGAYRNIDWEYLTDANNWWLVDSAAMKQFLYWIDRVSKEFAMVEDFDTIVGKWRLYGRYSLGWRGWRWCLGAQVT